MYTLTINQDNTRIYLRYDGCGQKYIVLLNVRLEIMGTTHFLSKHLIQGISPPHLMYSDLIWALHINFLIRISDRDISPPYLKILMYSDLIWALHNFLIRISNIGHFTSAYLKILMYLDLIWPSAEPWGSRH